MVGVPGRSKGCNTCRKRKVRCSLERPECSQCKRTGNKCLGYDRSTIFLHNNKQYTIHPAADIEIAPSRPTPATPIETPAPDAEPIRTYAELVKPSYDSINSMNLYNGAMRQHILATFYNQAHRTVGPLGGKMSWTGIIPQIASPGQPLQSAALSLAVAKLGRDMSDDHITRQSLKLYVNGLHQVQAALFDTERMRSDETLAACMLLTMYEVIECPSKARSGYLSHQNGCGRLVQLRGPEAHQEGLGHSLFLHFRYMATLEAMVTKTTFLTEDTWKTIPFEKEPKSNLDAFLDLFLEGLALMQEGDIMPKLPPNLQISQGVELLKRCWIYDRKLEDFYQHMKETEVSPMFWPVMSADEVHNDHHSESLATFAFEFPDIRIANTLMMYWAGLTILWAGMSHLYRMIDELLRLFAPTTSKADMYVKLGLPEPGHSWDFIITARRVCQSVSYCMREDMGKRVCVAPLSIVVDALRPWGKYEKEIDWAEAKLEEVLRSGMKIVRYLNAAEYAKEKAQTSSIQM